MATQAKDLHFVLFPLMAQGHMIPMVDIARILAQQGATVTIITTPVNANRFRPVITRAVAANLRIQVVELRLPLAEVGLLEGYESLDLVPPADMVKLFDAMYMLEGPAEAALRELNPAFSCIISDSFCPWTVDLASRFNVPRIVFYGPGCFALLCIHIIFVSDILSRINSNSDRFFLPGLPDRIKLTKAQACCWGNGYTGAMGKFFMRMREAENATYGIVVNSFEELEFKYFKEFAKSKGKKVWCIGPVSLCNKNSLDMAERGNKAAIDRHDCLKWLDSREPVSVVYVCLGSLTKASKEQAIELELGLELSNRPFIWCITNVTEELERWFSEEGFEERVKGRGLVVRGWAPQVLILSHRAVGGFVTHCGWNSVVEAVSAGVPMITWPQFEDQFLNEKFVTEVLKIGVRIGVEVPSMYLAEGEVGAFVKKEDVETTINKVMEEGVEGNVRRERAKEVAEMGKRAMEEGGSSYLNLISMFQDVIEHLANNMKLN